MNIDTKNISKTILNVAWMSIILGLIMEGILLIASASFGKMPQSKVIIADLSQKISWSTLVCMGVAVGTAASRMRPVMMGLAGLIAAPIAFQIAKVIHNSVAHTLTIGIAGGGPSPLVMAILKGIEYGVLGFILGKLGTSASLRSYILTSAAIGAVFAGIVIVSILKGPPVPTITLVTKGINELIFPIGCSLVLFVAQKFGSSIKDEVNAG